MTEYVISGSGSKKSKKQKAPVEAPNSLQSNATGQILDLLAFGPIQGVVGGLQGVYLDDTPVENADGTFNFDGIIFEERMGDPDQDIITGFTEVSNSREFNTEVKFATPVVRGVSNSDATAVIVTVRVPTLLRSDNSGNVYEHEIPFSIHIQANGVWYSAVSDLIEGKNTSPYERSYRIDLVGSGPYNIKVARGNEESDVQIIQDDLYWASMSEVIDVKHNYPYCALVGIAVEARLFGNSLPSRKYLTDLSIIKVPSNYNPITRQYTGLWDGTFKNVWSDNPAWCFYDLATHPVIGAGIENVNKYALYEIGQYCDELVPDGFGGMEPRFTCNTIFSSQEDAIDALNTLASVFRGMAYWGSDTVEPVADMPQPVRRVLTPSSVLDGEFKYSGTSLRERHSVAVVMWNDPEDGYEAKPEMVENAEMIELVGWREARITAVACTSRGQARRLGLWVLYSEQHETQTLEFVTTAANADLRPGDIIQVQDPHRAGARFGGRIKEVDGRRIYIDQVPPELHEPGDWYITFLHDSGELKQAPVAGIGNNYIELSYNLTGAVKGDYALSATHLYIPHFRVVSVSEGEGSTYQVLATEYNPDKFDMVEQGLTMPDRPETILPTGPLQPPSNLTASEYRYLAGNNYHMALAVGWTAPEDPRVEKYVLDVKSPSDMGFRTVYEGLGVSFDVTSAEKGEWEIRVRAASTDFGNSKWVTSSFNVSDLLLPAPPTSITLTMKVMAASVVPHHPFVGQEFEFYRSKSALAHNLVESHADFLGVAQILEDTGLGVAETYYYYVRSVNNYGKSDFVSTWGTTSTDAEDILDLLLKQHQDSQLGQWFQEEIGKISGVGPGSINDLIDEKIGGIDIQGDLSEIWDRLGNFNWPQLDWRMQQLEAMFDFAAHDDEKYYWKGTLVSFDGKLYSALQNVPEGTPLNDTEYWKEIGTYESLGDALSAIAAEVSRVDFDVKEINDKLYSQAQKVDGLWSQVNPPMSGSEEDYAGTEEVAAGVFSIYTVVSESELAMSERMDAMYARIGDEISAALQTEAEARVTMYNALMVVNTQMEATINNNIARIAAEEQARATGDSALADSISALTAVVSDNTALITTESSARADAVSAVVSQIETLATKQSNDDFNIHAALQVERDIRANEQDALANEISRVDVEVNDNRSRIAQETDARVDAISAMGQTLNLYKTEVAGLYATKHELNSVESDFTQAMSTQYNQLQAIAVAPSVFRQATPPTSAKKGDLWYDTSQNNQPLLYNGSGWEDVRDKEIADARSQLTNQISTLESEMIARVGPEGSLTQQVNLAQSVAEGKNKTYHQAAQPAGEHAVGDIWYKTNDGNKAHRWNGSEWVVVAEGTEALNAAMATVKDEIRTWTTSNYAVGSAVRTLQTSVNGHTSSIQSINQTTADIEGKLSSMWGVKMQAVPGPGNGDAAVFAGVGLSIEPGESGKLYSQFAVEADNFLVLQNKAGVGQTLPFAIRDGKTVIQTAIVDSLSLQGSAVTALHLSNTAPNTSGGAMPSVTMYADKVPIHALVTVTIRAAIPAGGRARGIWFKLYVNGVHRFLAGQRVNSDHTENISFQYVVTLGVRQAPHVFALTAEELGGGTFDVVQYLEQAYMVVQGVKR